MMTEFPIQKGDKVRIKDYVDPSLYYGFTTMFNEAWVKDVKEDRWGMPMVQIEWDQNHWSYNGAPNGWTFAEHFEKVQVEKDQIEMTDSTKPSQDVSDIINSLVKKISEAIEPKQPIETETSPPVEKTSSYPDSVDSLLKLLKFYDEASKDEQTIDEKQQSAIKAVTDQLPKAEAFIVIGVDREPDDSALNGALLPYVLKFGKSKDAKVVADCFLATLATEAHQELAIDKLTSIYQDQDNADAKSAN